MPRKTKRKKSTQTVSRPPMVSIKQKDEQLANDLKNMKQKDAIKYGTHLVKMISDNEEYRDLIFNLPLLVHLLKRYELEKKPAGIKQKIFKQSMAQDGSQYILPKLVDSRYVARAKTIIERKFNSNPEHDDKMALAIAKASLEMHGKNVQGTKISTAEVPLFQIALSASLDLIKKITKAEKDDKNLSITEASQALEFFPRWEEDLNEYREKIALEMRQKANDAKNHLVLPEQSTALLQKKIDQALETGHLSDADLQEFAKKKRLKSDAQQKIDQMAREIISQEMIDQKSVIALNMEKSLKDSFDEFGYLLFAYLFFMNDINEDTLLPIYIFQALLQRIQNDNHVKTAQQWQDIAKKTKSKEQQLLCLLAAYHLGGTSGEIVYQMGGLYRSLNLYNEGKRFYNQYLQKDGAKKDKFYKKISKDLSKNFK